ncbi:hypothetical protein TNCV_3077511 [Trichonephila clavipes]|nr:hypothetical protein TNCV_3077511 [Trichonephila clavipes]
MNLTWRNPPAHHWKAAKSPGLSLQFRSSSALQTALASLRSSHLGGMTFMQGGGQRPPTSLPLPPTSREDLRLDSYLEYQHAANIHVFSQTPRPYGTAVSVTNPSTGYEPTPPS